MNIGLFAYGSIILNAFSSNYQAEIKLSEPFVKTEIYLPLSFTRLSQYDTDKERVTLVPDEHGLLTPLYCAKLETHNMTVALKQLKQREGTESKKAISYIRKGVPQSANATYKTIIVDNEQWSYRVNNITKSNVLNMIHYLKNHDLDAVLITTFDSNYSKEQIKSRIAAKPKVAANTKVYFNELPEPVKKIHKASLKRLGVTNL